MNVRAVLNAAWCVAEGVGCFAGDLLDLVFPPEPYPPVDLLPGDWTD